MKSSRMRLTGATMPTARSSCWTTQTCERSAVRESVHIEFVLLWKLHMHLLQLVKRLFGFRSLHYDLSKPCPIRQQHCIFNPGNGCPCIRMQ